MINNNTKLAHTSSGTSDGANCAGSVQVTRRQRPEPLSNGTWAFVVTSTQDRRLQRRNYTRESAPSMCQTVRRHRQQQEHPDPMSATCRVRPRTTSTSRPADRCNGPFGLAANLPVRRHAGQQQHRPCPSFTGQGCSLGNEGDRRSTPTTSALRFAPNAAAAARHDRRLSARRPRRRPLEEQPAERERRTAPRRRPATAPMRTSATPWRAR